MKNKYIFFLTSIMVVAIWVSQITIVISASMNFNSLGSSFYNILDDSLNVRKSGWWPYGTCYTVGYDSLRNTVLAGSGEVLLVLDNSIPDSLQKVGELFLSGHNQRMAVVNDYTYVTVGGSKPGIDIINISNPTKPFKTGFYESPDQAHNIAIAGNYAYLGAGHVGLRIIDISNPYKPIEVGYLDTPGRVFNLVFSDNKIYLSDWEEGLRIIDVSNPSSPQELGFFPDPEIINLGVFDTYIIISDWDGYGIDILNAANPSDIKHFSSLYWDKHCRIGAIEIRGNYAFLTAEGLGMDSWSGLRIIDISDPSQPKQIGYFNEGFPFGELAFCNNRIFVAGWVHGVHIIDISDMTSPYISGSYDTPSVCQHVVVSGAYAYAGYHNEGLHIFDISNPSAPIEISGIYAGGGNAERVIVLDTLAIVAINWGPFICNIKNPFNPTLIGCYDAQGSIKDIVVAGHYAYLADTETGLRIFDISDPCSPTPIYLYNTPGKAYRLALYDHYLFVAAGDEGVRIIDVSNPLSPWEVGFYTTTLEATSIAIYDSVAFVGSGQDIYSVDISNISNPTHIGNVHLETIHGVHLLDIVVEAGYAYAADEPFGLRVVDVSNPSAMKEVGYYKVHGPAQSITISDDLIYLAANDAGFYILQFSEDITLATPIFNPIPGIYTEAQDVEIHCTTPGTEIHYTRNGSDPMELDSIYTNPIHISTTTILKARAYKADRSPSSIATGTYTITGTVATPTFDPSPDTYTDAQDITIHCSTPDAAIHYTNNGNDPTESDSIYNNPIHISATTTLKARAYKKDWNSSGVITGTYIIAGTFVDNQKLDSPIEFFLSPNYPNPFNLETIIKYQIASDCYVSIIIYNINGKEVKYLVRENMVPGYYKVVWDGKNNNSKMATSGIYFVYMIADNFKKIQKITLIR